MWIIVRIFAWNEKENQKCYLKLNKAAEKPLIEVSLHVWIPTL